MNGHAITEAGRKVVGSLLKGRSAGRVPQEFRTDLNRTWHAGNSLVARRMWFTLGTWNTVEAAAEAAYAPGSLLVRVAIRLWLARHGCRDQEDAVSRPVMGRSARVLAELARTAPAPRYCTEVAARLGFDTTIVFSSLREFERRGWVTSEQRSGSIEGRGVGSRIFYAITPVGLEASRRSG